MLTYTFKHSLGDVRYWASAHTEFRDGPPGSCPQCGGEPPVFKSGKTATCFTCNGSGAHGRAERRQVAYVRGPLTIGQARVEIEPTGVKEERYMCRETGIGSGTLYDADRLFPTQEEAMAYAERNLAEPWEPVKEGR